MPAIQPFAARFPLSNPVSLSIADIEDFALIRDRSVIDAGELAELKASIRANGLRMPIEVIPAAGAQPYALLSGLRRLTVWRELADEGGPHAIPAFIRPDMDEAAALAAIVEENETHAPLSPWEQGRIIWAAVHEELFPDLTAAARALFPAANSIKLGRIRSIANAVDEMGDLFAAPERWSQRRCLRLAAAVRDGFAPLIRAALAEAGENPLNPPTAEDDWRAILPCIEEAEALSDRLKPISNRPARLTRPRPGLSVRRERLRGGWALRLTGPDATDDLTDRVFWEIERLIGLNQTPMHDGRAPKDAA